MSISLQNEVWQKLDVRGAEKILLLCFADIADDQGGGIFASNEYTSWKTGLPERTVKFYRTKWRKIGALTSVGKIQLTTHRKVRGPNLTIGRGWIPVCQLNLSPFPHKPTWDEIKKGATVARFSERKKDAIEPAEGCKNTQKRVQKRDVHIRMIRENNREPDPPAAGPAPVQLIDGFRSLIEGMSERAITDIWASCRQLVPDCLPEEVVEMAALKLERAGGVRNVIGLLLRCVADWFEPSLVRGVREKRERRNAQERERTQQEAEQREQYRLDEEMAQRALTEMQQNDSGKYEDLRKKALQELRSESAMRNVSPQIWDQQACLLMTRWLKDERRLEARQAALARRNGDDKSRD